MDAEPARVAEIARSGGRPHEQLAALLDRAENGGRAAAHLAEARSALMHYCGLQSCRHTKGPPRQLDRRTFRHSFLLPDGTVRVVWELEHNTRPDRAVHHAVFTGPEDLTLAEWEVDAAFGGPFVLPEPPHRRPPPAGPDEGNPGGPGRLPGRDGPSGPGAHLDLSDLLGLHDPAGPAGLTDLADLAGLGEPAGPDPQSALPGHRGRRRAYTEGDSAEHARRLLRRATNANAPGPGVRSRLRAALAHDISLVTRRSAVVAGRLVSWSLYEHAFLLLDGTELSLWEIDHTRTPSGEPVCEVYTSQDAALDTAVRRIEAG
jgi:Family of unknown function (DUF6227)